MQNNENDIYNADFFCLKVRFIWNHHKCLSELFSLHFKSDVYSEN